MFRIYAIVIVVGLVGGAVWGAYGYYKDTQQRMIWVVNLKKQNNTEMNFVILCENII